MARNRDRAREARRASSDSHPPQRSATGVARSRHRSMAGDGHPSRAPTDGICPGRGERAYPMTFFYERLPLTFNIAQYFLERNVEAGHGESVAFYHRDQTFTYDQVYRDVRRTAGLLMDLGVECESRVAIVLPDSPELVLAFWRAIWAGCIPVPINTAYSVDDIRYILVDCRARLAVTTERWHERLAPIPSQFLRHVLSVDGEENLRSLLERGATDPEAMQSCRDEPAFWLYTSGTTGRPKGVIHAHHDMAVCAEFYGKQTLALNECDLSYSVAKIPFAYGLGSTLYLPMAAGGAAVLSDASNAFEVIADINRYRPTVLWAIPATYSALLALAELSRLDASSLRLCVSAAETLPETIWHRFRQQYGLEICEGIGTTELLHIFISNRPGACRPGTSGRPVPGYQVRVVGGNGETLPTGHIGDLEVTGESLMLGYWNPYRESREALCGHTMRTGDKY